MTSAPDPIAPELFEQTADPRPVITIDLEPAADVPTDRLFAAPTDTPPPRRRSQPAKRAPRLDWRPARSIALRAPGGTDDHRLPVTAAAFHDGWATVRIEDETGDRIVAYPAWRVVEIEMGNTP